MAWFIVCIWIGRERGGIVRSGSGRGSGRVVSGGLLVVV